MAGKKKKRARSERRAKLRKLDKLAQQRRKLIALEPGASIDRPIEVDATSQIAGAVRDLRCAGCNEGLRSDHETATVQGGRVVRTVQLKCRQCGEARTAYFALRVILN